MSAIKHMKRLGGKTVVAEFQEFEDSSNYLMTVYRGKAELASSTLEAGEWAAALTPDEIAEVWDWMDQVEGARS